MSNAKKKPTKGDVLQEGNEHPDDNFPVPAGMETIVRMADGWYTPDPAVGGGGAILGTLVGFRWMSKIGSFFYQIKLEQPCTAVIGNDIGRLQPGQILGVSERHQLRELRYYVASRARLYLKPTAKVQLEQGRTCWQWKIAAPPEDRRDPVNAGAVMREAQQAALDQALEAQEAAESAADQEAALAQRALRGG